MVSMFERMFRFRVYFRKKVEVMWIYKKMEGGRFGEKINKLVGGMVRVIFWRLESRGMKSKD